LFRVSRFPKAKKEDDPEFVPGQMSQAIVEGAWVRIIEPNDDITMPQMLLGRVRGFAKAKTKYTWKNQHSMEQPETDVLVKVELPMIDAGGDNIATIQLSKISNYVNHTTLAEYRVWIAKKIHEHVLKFKSRSQFGVDEQGEQLTGPDGEVNRGIPLFGLDPTQRGDQFSLAWRKELDNVRECIAM